MIPKALDELWDDCIELGNILEKMCKKDCFLGDAELNPNYPGRSTLKYEISEELNILWESLPDELSHFCMRISSIIRFIDFRRKYIQFGDDILAGMLSSNVDMATKRELLHRGYSISEIFDLLKQIRRDWPWQYVDNGFQEIVDKL